MTKEFLPAPNLARVLPLLSLDRTALTRYIAFLTGHNNLHYHRSLREPDTHPLCRFCDLFPETSAHLFAECPRFATLRLDTTGSFSLLSLSTSWTVDQLLSFLDHTSVSAAMDDLHALPFTIEHDWSDVDPDPPDSDAAPPPSSLSDDGSVL